MKIAGSTALVTGANRGLGLRFAEELVARGANVYAAARSPELVATEGVTPIRLDITDPRSVAAAAELAQDVDLLINNAGSSLGADLLTGDWADLRQELEVHYLGSLSVIRAFAPALAANGGGAILNVLSVLSWVTFPGVGAYSAAKSAEWSMTNAIRQQLAEQDTQVAALHVGYMDTDMTRGLEVAKTDPALVAALALDALETGAVEILADELSQQVQAGLGIGVPALYPQFAAQP